jgi:hypothetical protein
MNFLASGLPMHEATAHSQTRRSRRSFIQAAGALACGALGLSAGSALASEQNGDSSHAAQQEALRSMPINKLNEEAQRKVMSVLERPSIYRRLPTKTVDCDPEMFVFMVRNPEVVVNIWEIMGISQMVAERTGPYTWDGKQRRTRLWH